MAQVTITNDELLDRILASAESSLAHEIAPPDIYDSLVELEEAIRCRREQEPTGASLAEKIDQEERICIVTRSLAAMYDSLVIWSRKKHEELGEILGLYFECAASVMTVDAESKRSVKTRCDEMRSGDRLVEFVTAN